MAVLGTVLLVGPAAADAKETMHTVYAGQRLGSIARRYNVTIEALCAANGIRPTDKIRPGQKLVIPDKNTKPKKPADAALEAKKTEKAPGQEAKKRAAAPQDPGVHVVARGHTLSAISNRYGVTVAAICHASGIGERSQLRVGQRLVIPDRTDPTGRHARQVRLSGALDDERDPSLRSAPGSSFQKYSKKPWRRGYVTLRSHAREWKGFVLGSKGEVLAQASSKINWALGSSEKGPRVDPRLIRLIAQVSDQFGGRPLRIVSGYRTKSFVAASKHKEGRALDFSIPGVPNEAVRDYLRTLKNVGVGYYPNSSFVHLDVRGYNAYWIDYAGPGEAPRKSPHKKRRPGPEKPSEPTEDIDHEGPPDDAAPDEFHHAPGQSAEEAEKSVGSPGEAAAAPGGPDVPAAEPAPAGADEGPAPPPPAE